MANMKRRSFLETVGTGSLAAFSLAGLEEPAVKKTGRDQIYGQSDSWIKVNLARLAWNFSQVKARVKVPIMAVVKANAYGHGLVGASKALETAGAHWLMVGKLQEAVALREAGIRCPILNFGPFDRQDCEEIIGRGISQSVFTEDAVFLEDAARKLEKKASVHVDIDTGMGRTGAASEKAPPLIEKISSLSHLKIQGICTTLTEDPDFDKEQLRRFLEVCSAARAKGISLGLRHAASSAGIFYSPEFCLDMVRPGITLYGYYPNARTRKEDSLNLRPVLKLSARIIFIKDMLPGESLSYLRAFKAEKKMRVATVGIGYSDGYSPQLGGRVSALIRNRKYPVLNLVTANHLMVELGDDREVQIGDEVTLIDPEKTLGLSADALAEQSGVPDYRILISLSPLVPRIYSQ
jgi:alanine racemase